MNELEQIFTEMLNHIDDHKEAYNKPQWTNEAIVKTWIKTNESKLKNLFISGVSNPLNVFLVGDNVYFGHKKAKVIWTSVRYVDIKLINGKMYQGVPVSVIRHA